MQTNYVRAVAAILLGASVSAWSSDFTVVNTSNAGAGSLRQAIIDANANPGFDRVLFNIPGSGLKIIRVTSALPDVTGPVEIDGYSQPGSRPNELADSDNAVRLIELDGVSRTYTAIVLPGGNSTLRGLSIRNFAVALSVQSSSNLVVGNLLGSDASPPFLASSNGNGFGNYVGVAINSPNTNSLCCVTVGGVLREDRNVIAGNAGSSIRIGETGGVVTDCRVLGNFLGVKSSGVEFSVLGGSSVISVRKADRLVVGGLEPGARNILANWGTTIYAPSQNVQVIGNYFGLSSDGINPIAPRQLEFPFWMSGIVASESSNCLVAWNRIGYQTCGVDLRGDLTGGIPAGPKRITISSNSIFGSRDHGIYLSNDARTNDFLDFDVGSNNRQNFPELSSAGYSGGHTVVSGVLNSAPASTYRIEFFANPVPHPSGFGEGEFFLGSTNVTTDFIGSAPFEMTFAGVLSLQSYMTATATDAEGNTSMFSRWMQARSLAAPLFHLNPKPVTVMPYTNIVFRADGSGAGPLSLQWRRNGIDLLGATNFTLSLSNVVWEDRGTYVLVASNSFGVTESLAAELVVIAQPTILAQPVDVIVPPGTNVTFRLQAGGMLPLAYQWRRDGVPLPGETNSSLALSNVDWTMSGGYSAAVSNAFGVVESAPGGLFVKMRPFIIQQPISQSVASGAVAYLSVAVTNSATLPLTYLWRSNNLVVATWTSMKHVSVFPIGPVVRNVGYTVIVSNSFGAPGILSLRANLVVLPDADGDGLPDAFEDAYGLDRNSAADAILDLDGDGVSNGAEYAAGTDPADGLNQLRIANIRDDAGAAEIEFGASSNKTYTVEFREALGQGTWQPLINLPARETNRVERLMDVKPGVRRFYRLLTPATP